MPIAHTGTGAVRSGASVMVHLSVSKPADGIVTAQRTGRRRHSEDQVQTSIRPHPANLAARHTTGTALDEFLPAVSKGVPA